MQPLERLGESTDLRLLNDVVDLICERKDLTAVIYDICNYQESDSGCAFGKVSAIATSFIYANILCSLIVYHLTGKLTYNTFLNVESPLKSELYIESVSFVKHLLLF